MMEPKTAFKLGLAIMLGFLALLVPLWGMLHSSSMRALVERSQARKAPAGSLAGSTAALGGAYRFERGGWIYVHLQGKPSEIGYQHGYLLAPEIADGLKAVQLDDVHTTRRPWQFFRQAAHEMLWPGIDPEYRRELEGIVRGVRARGIEADIDDIVALNAFEELPGYYVPWYNVQHKVAGAPHLTSPGNCSAFVATGAYTRDHRIVMAHNNWTSYLDGERWRIVFDIVPERGYRILMDGYPGVITSDDDFGVNSDGIMITETTITQFAGWNPHGKPEFARSRKALQYAASIDDYVRIMLDGNNGGYANDWLLADNKTGEIAQFELGLKAYNVWRTKDGYFVGSNFARDPKVLREDTTFDPNNPENSPNARRARWEELMKQYKGQIDVNAAEKFMGDHYDAYQKKEQADEHTLCGHVDASGRGEPTFDWGPHYPGGAVQGKAMDSTMAQSMCFVAHRGHPCGEDFVASSFLKAHPEYEWQAPLLRDMKAGPWTMFKAGEQTGQ